MHNANEIVLLYLDLGRRQYAEVAARKSRTEYNPSVEFSTEYNPMVELSTEYNPKVELSTEYNPKVERPGFSPAQTKWQAPWGVEHEDAYSV